MTDIILPQLGETVTEGTITRWLKSPGEQVQRDEPLYEVSTDKVDTEVPSPSEGVMGEIFVQEGVTVEVGTLLAKLQGDDAGEAGAGVAPAATAPAAAVEPAAAGTAATETAAAEATIYSEQVSPDDPLFDALEQTDPILHDLDAGGKSEGSPSEPSAPATAPAPPAPVAAAPPPPAEPPPAVAAVPVAADSGSKARMSPVVRRLLNRHDIDPQTIQGTGPNGRITRQDAEAAVAAKLRGEAAPPPQASTPSPAPAASPPPAPPAPVAAPAPSAPAVQSTPAATPAPAAAPASQPAAAPAVVPGPAQVPVSATASQPVASSGEAAPTSRAGDERISLSRIRKATGEHMVRSKATSPHVLTAVEVDFEEVEKVRRAHKDSFQAEEGFGLTYLPFIARALCDSLAVYPRINASVSEDELVVHHFVNLAIAVDLDFEGLIAPVIHGADQLRLRGIARQISDLAKRARSKSLGPDEVSGGTFTISNPGQWGTMMQFPIINQPQVAILSTDGIKRKPVVVSDSRGGESIAIHSVGVLALAWDHRAFDGAYVAAFLDHMRGIIQNHNWEEELS